MTTPKNASPAKMVKWDRMTVHYSGIVSGFQRGGSPELLRKDVRDEVASPPTRHRAPDTGGFAGQRFIQQLLFHDSKPIPAQALTQTV
jgi:hypothetical protein